MPIKIYFLALLIILIGLALVVFFIFRLKRVFVSGNLFQKGRELFFCLLFILSSLLIAASLLPCFNLLDHAICEGPAQKQIALTFDDGPNEPYTSQVLDILKQHRVPATFFLVGENIRRNPQVTERMIQEGHEIGNHTSDHRPLLFMSRQGIRTEIEGWEQALPVSIRFPTLKWFRAPHGWKNFFLPPLLREKGYRLVGWTVGVWDSDQPGEEILLARLKKRVGGGSIVLLHDGCGTTAGANRSQTVAVLARMIDYFRGKGFEFVSLSVLLGESHP